MCPKCRCNKSYPTESKNMVTCADCGETFVNLYVSVSKDDINKAISNLKKKQRK